MCKIIKNAREGEYGCRRIQPFIKQYNEVSKIKKSLFVFVFTSK